MHDLTEECAGSFDTEIKSGQAGLNHPNVLRMIGAGRDNFQLNGTDEGDRFFIVTELAANGELFDLVSTADNLNGNKMKYARFLFK